MDDFIGIDSTQVKDVLHPKDPTIRRRDRLGGFSLPSNASHQTLMLLEEFSGEVSIWVDGALLFSGKAKTDFSTGKTDVILDLGLRSATSPKHLRVEYGGRCVESSLDGSYPIVMLRCDTDEWLFQLTDYWPMFE